MRDYQFKIDNYHRVIYSQYIHFACSDGNNYLVGRLNYLSGAPNDFWVIEYFDDCLSRCLELPFFYGISGCNYKLGKRVFIYNESVPVFVSERLPNQTREDLPEILESLGLSAYSPKEYLMATNGVCSDNYFFLHDLEDANEFYNNYLHRKSRPSKVNFLDMWSKSVKQLSFNDVDKKVTRRDRGVVLHKRIRTASAQAHKVSVENRQKKRHN